MPAEFLLSGVLNSDSTFDDYALEAALDGGADGSQSDDKGLEEFSPRIAQLMTSRRQVGQGVGGGRRGMRDDQQGQRPAGAGREGQLRKAGAGRQGREDLGWVTSRGQAGGGGLLWGPGQLWQGRGGCCKQCSRPGPR